MNSIPLPALDIQPPQQPGPMQMYGNLMRLKAMQLQTQQAQAEAPLRQQALQQQVQSGGLQIQNQERLQASQQAIMDAYSQSGGNLSKTYDLAASSGKALPMDLLKLRQANMQMQQQALQLLNTRGDAVVKQGQMLEGAADAVRNAKPQDRESVYEQQLRGLTQAGIDTSQMPQQYPGDDQFQKMWLGIKTHQNVLQEAQTIAAANKDTAQTEEANSTAAKNNLEIQNGGPFTDEGRFISNYLKSKGLPNTPGNQLAAQQEYNRETRIQPAIERENAYASTREYPVIDTKNDNRLVYASAADINAANAATPGRFAPAAQGDKALGKTALIEDIRGNLTSVRQALQNPKMPEFTTGQRSAIALALGGPEPGGALTAAFRGGVLGSLTPEQQQYLINLAQLKENAMAMRSVLGAGQGSEDLRAAISATIPGPRTPSKMYGLKQLDAFEKVLNRLEQGVPNVPLAGQAARGAPLGGGAGSVTVQIPGSPPGRIPASALQKFKADHPNARVSQ